MQSNSNSNSNQVQVETSDVIKLIQQFLAENNLIDSLKALQNESKIYSNIEPKNLHKNILNGNWLNVLNDISLLNFTPSNLIPLYDQIILEFIEQNELDAAKTILRQTDPLEILRLENPDRYIYLESLLSRKFFPQTVYKNISKTQSRSIIYNNLKSLLTNVDNGRLLTLLSHSLKWQFQQKLINNPQQYNIFSGNLNDQKPEMDHSISNLLRSIKFPKKQHPESIKFSPCAKLFIIATFDGFVELWDYRTGKLRKDIIYQQKNEIMVAESCALSMAFSPDSKLLATGLKSGKIIIWNPYNGKIIKQFIAHSQGVTSLEFNNDSTVVLSSSFDHTARGHSSFVNSATFSMDSTKIISASSDGCLKIWDASTTECIQTLSLIQNSVVPFQTGVNIKPIHTIKKFPLNNDLFLVANQSAFIYLVDINGKLVKSITTETESSFICATISQSGEFIYTADENHKIYCFSTERGLLISKFDTETETETGTRTGTRREEIIGLEHHPLANILVVYSSDGKVEIFN